MPAPTDPLARAEQYLEAFAERLAASPTPVRLADEAATASADLSRSDPEAWQAFADAVTTEVVATRLRQALARHRHAAVHHHRTTHRRAVFAAVTADTRTAVEAGEPPPSPFDARYHLPGVNVWTRLGQMRRPELRAVARQRAGQARSNAIEAIFLAAVAAALPDDDTTVEEVLSETDLVQLHGKAESTTIAELPDLDDTDDTDDDEEAADG